MSASASPDAKRPPQETTAIDVASVRAEYARVVRERIESNREYPAVARRRGVEGTAVVSFSISTEGAVSIVSVVNSSGSKYLDDAALVAVLKSSPFPAPPAEAFHESMRARVPIVFKLDDEL